MDFNSTNLQNNSKSKQTTTTTKKNNTLAYTKSNVVSCSMDGFECCIPEVNILVPPINI